MDTLSAITLALGAGTFDPMPGLPDAPVWVEAPIMVLAAAILIAALVFRLTDRGKTRRNRP